MPDNYFKYALHTLGTWGVMQGCYWGLGGGITGDPEGVSLGVGPGCYWGSWRGVTGGWGLHDPQ